MFAWIRALKSILFSINVHLFTQIDPRPLTCLGTDRWGPVGQATPEEAMHDKRLVRTEPNQRNSAFVEHEVTISVLVGQQTPRLEMGCGSALSHHCVTWQGWDREGKAGDPLTYLQAWDLTGLQIVNIYCEMPRLHFFCWLLLASAVSMYSSSSLWGISGNNWSSSAKSHFYPFRINSRFIFSK